MTAGARTTVPVAMVLVLMLAGGCSIALHHGELPSPPRTYSDSIDASSRADGMNWRVGWGRCSVFYIPCVPIHIQGDASAEVMEQVRDALQQAGYKVRVVEAQIPASTPELKCNVDTFYFNNYTWLFPFVPTWGDIDMTVSLQRGGQVAWTQSFHGHGWSANFFDGYSSASNEAMAQILADMVQAFATDQFHNALVQTS